MARFLIVDDDPVVRHILGAILEALGHEHDAVDNGASALEFLSEARRTENLPALIFMDFQLGEMTGIELLAQIRNSFDAAKLPVAMLSSNSREEVYSADPSTTPDYFLTKPFTLDVVGELLLGLGF